MWSPPRPPYSPSSRYAARMPRTARLLLVECVRRRLSMRHVLVGHRDGLTIRRRREVNLIHDLALAMIGFLDRVGIDLLQRHCRLAWVADDWILLAIELRLITLAVPVHLEPVVGHLVLDRARGVVSLEYHLL